MSGNLRAVIAATQSAKAESAQIELETTRARPDEDAGGMTRGRGRPATGKRSDPAYEKSGVLLRKTTRRRTAGLLLNYPDKDVSDLVEELLTQWNNSHPE